MNFECFGSGSAGNMYTLKANSGCTLVLDMGFSFARIKKNLDFNLSNVNFLISHKDHIDHGKGAPEAIKAGCNVYHSLPEYQPLEVGEFTVLAFPVIHNVPTQGFIIQHEEMGNLLYLTDTGYLDYKFEDINHWLIEANHDEDIIFDRAFDGKSNISLSNRNLTDHLSLQGLLKMLANQNLSMAETICLIHLSDTNSHAERFKSEVVKATGKPVYIAEKGLQLSLNLNDF